jgi:hypothetical protein
LKKDEGDSYREFRLNGHPLSYLSERTFRDRETFLGGLKHRSRRDPSSRYRVRFRVRAVFFAALAPSLLRAMRTRFGKCATVRFLFAAIAALWTFFRADFLCLADVTAARLLMIAFARARSFFGCLPTTGFGASARSGTCLTRQRPVRCGRTRFALKRLSYGARACSGGLSPRRALARIARGLFFCSG